MASTKRALANNPIVDVTAIHSSRIVKQQALNVVPVIKRQARCFPVIDQQALDRGTLIKFNGQRIEGLKKDKVSLCVGKMKQFLVR